MEVTNPTVTMFTSRLTNQSHIRVVAYNSVEFCTSSLTERLMPLAKHYSTVKIATSGYRPDIFTA